jgi:hypothetical protein
MEPKLWELVAVGLSQTGESSGHTAREWSEKHKLVAAINAGMFEGDQKTHLGYMRFRDHVYTGHVNKYQSIAAFDPRGGKDVPRFHIFDLDTPGISMQSIQQDYDSAVQNLRLVKRPGSNQVGPAAEKMERSRTGRRRCGPHPIYLFPVALLDARPESGIASGRHRARGGSAPGRRAGSIDLRAHRQL